MPVSNDNSLHPQLLARGLLVRSASLIIILLSTFEIASAQTAQPFCAFEVRVVTPTGAPAAGLNVAMIRADNDKTVSKAITGADGVVRFCDAPVVPVYVEVVSRPCGLTKVGPARAEWPDTEKLLITHNSTKCEEFNPAPQCQVLLRISDESGHPVAGARFETKGPLGAGSVVSDPLGRLFLSIKRLERIDGSVVKEGFWPTSFSEECLDDLEPKVVLRQR